MKNEPILSIIIVKYRAEEYLKKCLESLVQSSIPKGFPEGGKFKDQSEVIVIDNDQKNIGYGAGCNQGAKKAKGKYLLFLNPDTVILNNALKTMINYMEKNPQVSVLGPKIYKNIDLEKQLSFCRFPDWLTAFFVFSPLKLFWPNNTIFGRYVYNENKKDNGILEVGAVAGAAMLIRKEMFDKVGGFDERFFLYFEENDLCWRIRKQGGRIVYFPKAEIIHFGGKSTMDVGKSSREFKKSRAFFFKKHYGILGSISNNLIAVLDFFAAKGS